MALGKARQYYASEETRARLRKIGNGNYSKGIRISAAYHERLVEVLRWYEEMARNCRKITDSGEEARTALDADGGSKAFALLAEIEESGK